MTMLSVYKKIFKQMLLSNLNEVFNLRIFASFNFSYIFQSIHLEVNSFMFFWCGMSILPNNNSVRIMHEINMWYHLK